MSRSLARTITLALAACLLALGAARAGELVRPVPSDAQITRFTRFNIRYSIRDIIADGVTRVEFYITEDMGGTWRLYGDDPDRVSPMTVEVPGEGVYGFVCVVTDSKGNRERPPVSGSRPETVIVVDRTAPTAKWIEPRQDVIGRGQTVEMSWESADAHFGDAPVKLEYAINAKSNFDKSAEWVTLQDNLPPVGTHRWEPTGSHKYNFRLIATDRAGNMAFAYCPATFTVDNVPPYTRMVDPLRSNKLENDIKIDAVDNENGSGVKEFSLYYSENGAVSWTLMKEVTIGNESVPVKRRPGDVIPFKAPRSGEYPLWPVIFDEAGNASPLPAVGVTGSFVLVIDNEPPVVTLSNSFLQGRGSVLANEQRLVEWTAYDTHLQPNSASIALSLDNGKNWQEMGSLLATSGSELITFPFNLKSEEARLRVTVYDEFGNVGEGLSDTFRLAAAETTIDSVTPLETSSPTLPAYEYSTPATPVTPSLAPTGDGWFDTGAPSTPGASALPPLPTFDPGSGMQGFDPFGGPGAIPGGDAYGGGSDIFGGPTQTNNYSGESSASFLPQSLMRPGAAGSASAPPPPPTGLSTPPGGLGLGGSTPSDAVVWTPSGVTPASPLPAPPGGQAGIPDPSGWVDSPGAGASASSGLNLIPPPPGGSSWGAPDSGVATAPPSDGGWVSSIPAPPATPATPIPPATPTPPAAPALSLAPPASSPPLSPPDASPGSLAPPPSPDTAGSLFPSTSGPTGLSLEGIGGIGDSLGGVALSPFGGGEPAQPPAAFGQQPGLDALSNQAPAPVADAAPLSPPPLLTPSQRPANLRAESDHYVKESKAFRAEGRPDLALAPARRAVETDPSNASALMEVSQVYARMDPPDFVSAANLAKEATSVQPDWETWWNCAEVFYLWAYASNSEIQAAARSGQTPPMSLIDERNSTLNNATIAINNAASVVAAVGDSAAGKKVTVTQGMIFYLRALTVQEPPTGSDKSGYKATVAPMLLEAMPYFENALKMGGPPEYTETFQLGIINFRIAGLERDTGNQSEAIRRYQEAVRYLEEATTAGDAPSGGPREAYYMLGLAHEHLSGIPNTDRARHLELALRYWRQTAEFYPAGSPYRTYAEQRIDALTREMGL